MGARGLLGLLLVILVLGGGYFAWRRFEGDAPLVQAPESLVAGSGARSVALEFDDPGAGLREIRVLLVQGDREHVLAEEHFPGGFLEGATLPRRAVPVEVEIDAGKRELTDGEAQLVATARDWSWRGSFLGNETRVEVPVRVDRSPPRVSVSTGLTYVRRGGSGAVAYTLGEPTPRDGVVVGDRFFRGYPAPGDEGGGGGRRVAVFAVPTDAPRDPEIRVVAEDGAGNEGGARWPVVVQERRFAEANVTLPASFLDRKVPGLARSVGIDPADPVAAFREINTRVRAENEARVRELTAESEPSPLWDGAFQQLPNSKVTSRFAEQRSYFVGGKEISEAVHYGYDLASTAAAPITAANGGRVVFAGELGIYGNCVLLDHGMGVATLYGHLSRLDVAAGDRVSRGQPVGLSGATGLAGGDHLHFAVLVGETYTDPLEWWDPQWMRTHIEARLGPSSR